MFNHPTHILPTDGTIECRGKRISWFCNHYPHIKICHREVANTHHASSCSTLPLRRVQMMRSIPYRYCISWSRPSFLLFSAPFFIITKWFSKGTVKKVPSVWYDYLVLCLHCADVRLVLPTSFWRHLFRVQFAIIQFSSRSRISFRDHSC